MLNPIWGKIGPPMKRISVHMKEAQISISGYPGNAKSSNKQQNKLTETDRH